MAVQLALPVPWEAFKSKLLLSVNPNHLSYFNTHRTGISLLFLWAEWNVPRPSISRAVFPLMPMGHVPLKSLAAVFSSLWIWTNQGLSCLRTICLTEVSAVCELYVFPLRSSKEAGDGFKEVVQRRLLARQQACWLEKRGGSKLAILITLILWYQGAWGVLTAKFPWFIANFIGGACNCNSWVCTTCVFFLFVLFPIENYLQKSYLFFFFFLARYCELLKKRDKSRNRELGILTSSEFLKIWFFFCFIFLL